MISLPFQQQFTWRKLGYLYYTDSLQYRAILEENPQWTVTELPPVGANLNLPTPGNVTGGLEQSSFMFGLPTGAVADGIYPYDTVGEYVRALVRYTSTGVKNRVGINGLTQDSEQAYTGIQ